MSSNEEDSSGGTNIADLVQDKLHLCSEEKPPIVKTDLELPDGQKALAFVLDNVFTKEVKPYMHHTRIKKSSLKPVA